MASLEDADLRVEVANRSSFVSVRRRPTLTLVLWHCSLSRRQISLGAAGCCNVRSCPQMGGSSESHSCKRTWTAHVSHNRGVLENLNSANSALVARQDALAEALTSRDYNPGLAKYGAASVIQAAAVSSCNPRSARIQAGACGHRMESSVAAFPWRSPGCIRPHAALASRLPTDECSAG